MRLIALLCALVALPAHAIIGGELDGDPPDSPALRVLPDDCASPWAGVVSILIGNGVFSGVVIADRWVLTAAHVASSARTAPEALSVRIPCRNQHESVSAVFVHPDYKGNTGSLSFDDLALLRLTHPLPADIPRYPLAREMPSPGTVATLIGYGAGGDPHNGITIQPRADVKRLGENALDAFVRNGDTPPQIYLFDFDGADPATSLLGGGTLGNRREATFAYGDSGGPAFVRTGDTWELVGINTFQLQFPVKPPKISLPPPKFSSGGGGILVAPYADWIKATMRSSPE